MRAAAKQFVRPLNADEEVAALLSLPKRDAARQSCIFCRNVVYCCAEALEWQGCLRAIVDQNNYANDD
jgi:hypothetical protein